MLQFLVAEWKQGGDDHLEDGAGPENPTSDLNLRPVL